MRPLRATFHYTVDVPFDSSNPDHAEYFGSDFALEKRISHGYITDIIELKDTESVRLLQGTKEDKDGNRHNEYSDALGSRSGVYVIFWEDKGDNYKMHVEDYNMFTVSSQEMNQYVKEQRTV